MINNPIIFYTASFLIIVFALGSMFIKNIIYSLLCAVMVFFSASILFYMLGSEYNAIIQAAIYGFAVPVIIGISIMFTTGKSKEEKSLWLPLVILICSAFFVAFFADALIFSNMNYSEIFHYMPNLQFNSFDIMSAFARGIYINYVWAFELLALLLTIVIAGLSIFNKREIYNRFRNKYLKSKKEEAEK